MAYIIFFRPRGPQFLVIFLSFAEVVAAQALRAVWLIGGKHLEEAGPFRAFCSFPRIGN